MNPLGELLERARADSGLTLTDFAQDVLGINQSLVSRYINGKQSPGRQTTRKIAERLRMPQAEVEALIPSRSRGKPSAEIHAFIELAAKRAAQEMFEQMTKGPDRVPAAGDPDPRERRLLLALNAALAIMTADDVAEAQAGHRAERQARRRAASKDT